MKHITIAVYSTAPTTVPIWSAAYRTLLDQKLPIRLLFRSKDDLFSEKLLERFIEKAVKADALVVLPHGGSDSVPGFDRLITGFQGKLIHIQPSQGADEELEMAKKYTNLDADGFRKCLLYLRFGGHDNLVNFLIYLYKTITKSGQEPLLPKPVPTEGIYHPDYQTLPDRDTYLTWAKKRLGNAPIVGLWFYQVHWQCRNLDFIDSIIREIEKQGAIVIPLFHNRFPDKELGNMGVSELVETYFQQDGKTIIDVLLSPMFFSMTTINRSMLTVYPQLDCPVLQLVLTSNPHKVWEESVQGVSPMDVSVAVAQPEFDGCLITTVVAAREINKLDPLTKARLAHYQPVQERVNKVVRQCLSWARLRRTPPVERKIAVIFHHYPPRKDKVGSAFGLDSFASVKGILDRLDEDGYTIDYSYENGEAIAKDLLDRLTNDTRYMTQEKMAEAAEGRLEAVVTSEWFNKLSKKNRVAMQKAWGDSPGTVFVHKGETLIGGLRNGNIFIGLQPPRGRLEHLLELDKETDITELGIHNPDMPPTHHYLAFYRWIKKVFKAHAVIHVGKHGSLEWLPGKSVGLANTCYPDLAIDDLPHLYPYIVNNPGEGTQAKRRSYTCILDHMIPPQTNADKSPPLLHVEELIERVYQAKLENPSKLPVILDQLWEKVKETNLNDDIHIENKPSLNELEMFCETLHGYLTEVGDTNINDGLHVFGKAPHGQLFIETLTQMTKVPSGDNPSLRDRVGKVMGLDVEKLLSEPGYYLPARNLTYGQLLEEIHKKTLELLSKCHNAGWPQDQDKLKKIVRQIFPDDPKAEPQLCGSKGALTYTCTYLATKLLKTTEELTYAVHALNGGFVPPGGSGCPTRGQHDILPTGRNFYSVNPQKIPTKDAWEVGVGMAEALLERYQEDKGEFPKEIGMVIWGSPTMRTQGDDVAEVLYLMGLCPVWHPASGIVQGLEVIPHAELGRPRIDVTIRTSGLFRDTFPNIMELIDCGVHMVSALKEAPEVNFLAAHVKADTEEFLASGLSYEEANIKASFRVFSDKPGCYGAGVGDLLDAGKWKNTEELGDVWINWGGYAYGEGTYGKAEHSFFKRRMSKLDLTVKNQDSREMDILSSDDYNAYHGGMNAAVLTASGKKALSYSGDSSDPRRPRVKSTSEESMFVFRTRVLNPKWINGMKRHGYKGAGDMSRLVDICFHWDATSDVIEGWMYEGLAETYAMDKEMQDFFKEHNPAALMNISERLLEAIRRGMWKPSPEIESELTDIYIEMEGEMEAC